jgi:hypothetical protein
MRNAFARSLVIRHPPLGLWVDIVAAGLDDGCVKERGPSGLGGDLSGL